MAISKVSGHSVSAAGGMLTVVGGALTIATLGAGLPVLIAGVATGVAGGITRWGPKSNYSYIYKVHGWSNFPLFC